MKRRDFITRTALATLAATAVTAAAEVAAPPRKRTPPKPKPAPPPVEIITPPVLQNLTESGVTVFWTTSSPAAGWVEYGETPALGQIARGEVDGLLPYDERVLRVRIGALKPGATYHYRVQTVSFDFTHPYSVGRGAPQPGSVYQFKTLDAGAAELSFVVWNDTHQNKETLARLVEQLPRFPADFLVWNGDIFNAIPTDDMLVNETLHPAGLEYAATRPVFVVRGNHDVRGCRARALRRTLEPVDGKFYQQFRHGPAAVLALDTGEDKVDTHTEYGGLVDFAGYRTEQVPWLQAAVARPEFRDAPFRILFTHIPLRGHAYSADSCAKWERLLRDARVDLAISGHTHRHAHHEPTTEQPWPLLVGGGPAPAAATFIHVHVTTQRLAYRMFDLAGKPIGEWELPRRA